MHSGSVALISSYIASTRRNLENFDAGVSAESLDDHEDDGDALTDDSDDANISMDSSSEENGGKVRLGTEDESSDEDEDNDF